jgi:hypothetical protein
MPPCHNPKALNANVRLEQGANYPGHVVAEPPSRSGFLALKIRRIPS